MDRPTQEARSAEPNRRPSSSRPAEPLPCGGGRAEAPTETLPQDELGSKATRAAKSSSPKARRSSTNTPSPPAGRTEKKQRPGCKTAAPHSEGTERNAAPAHHTEQTKYGSVPLRARCRRLRPAGEELCFFPPVAFRLEQELRRLKSELQTSRQSEQELRSHICNLTNSERSLRPEVSLLRQSNMLLQSK